MLKKITKTGLTFGLFLLLLLVGFTFISMRGVIRNMQSFIVLTGSMQPTLHPGSVVYTHKKQFYTEGDIITFKIAGNETVTHRIVGIIKENGVIAYQTKGDANRVADKDAVSPSNVIGTVQFSLPYLGYAVNAVRTLPGLIGLIIFPGIVFIAFELLTIKREIEKQAEEKLLAKLSNLQQPA